jgi:hypothetical protein
MLITIACYFPEDKYSHTRINIRAYTRTHTHAHIHPHSILRANTHTSAPLQHTQTHTHTFTYRELEVMLQDLQEGMRKRNPDSVSSLIRATASDQVEQQRKQQAVLIGELKAELAGEVWCVRRGGLIVTMVMLENL